MITDDDIIRTAIFELQDHGFRVSIDARAGNGRFIGTMDLKDGKLPDFSDALLHYLPETLALIETREELEQGTWG